jgi:hypothetical protein
MKSPRVKLFLQIAVILACGILIATVVIFRPPKLPSLLMSDATYSKTNDASGSYIEARFFETNSEQCKSWLLTGYITCVETANGWATNGCYYRSSIPLYNGTTIGGSVSSFQQLPLETKRWQLGYFIEPLTPRELLDLMLPPKWKIAWRGVLDRCVSDNRGENSIIWGPVREVNFPEK